MKTNKVQILTYNHFYAERFMELMKRKFLIEDYKVEEWMIDKVPSYGPACIIFVETSNLYSLSDIQKFIAEQTIPAYLTHADEMGEEGFCGICLDEFADVSGPSPDITVEEYLWLCCENDISPEAIAPPSEATQNKSIATPVEKAFCDRVIAYLQKAGMRD